MKKIKRSLKLLFKYLLAYLTTKLYKSNQVINF